MNDLVPIKTSQTFRLSGGFTPKELLFSLCVLTAIGLALAAVPWGRLVEQYLGALNEKRHMVGVYHHESDELELRLDGSAFMRHGKSDALQGRFELIGDVVEVRFRERSGLHDALMRFKREGSSLLDSERQLRFEKTRPLGSEPASSLKPGNQK